LSSLVPVGPALYSCPGGTCACMGIVKPLLQCSACVTVTVSEAATPRYTKHVTRLQTQLAPLVLTHHNKLLPRAGLCCCRNSWVTPPPPRAVCMEQWLHCQMNWHWRGHSGATGLAALPQYMEPGGTRHSWHGYAATHFNQPCTESCMCCKLASHGSTEHAQHAVDGHTSSMPGSRSSSEPAL
jgi:hypothetical protein